jgi:hypothetical protein
MLNKFVDNKGNAKARCESGFKCKEGCIFGPKNLKIEKYNKNKNLPQICQYKE